MSTIHATIFNNQNQNFEYKTNIKKSMNWQKVSLSDILFDFNRWI